MVKVRFGGDFHYPNAETESAAALAGSSEEGHNLLLVAGGVGANPIASVLKHFAQRKGEKCRNCCFGTPYLPAQNKLTKFMAGLNQSLKWFLGREDRNKSKKTLYVRFSSINHHFQAMHQCIILLESGALPPACRAVLLQSASDEGELLFRRELGGLRGTEAR